MTSKANKNDGTKVTVDVAQVKSVLMEQPDFLQPVDVAVAAFGLLLGGGAACAVFGGNKAE